MIKLVRNVFGDVKVLHDGSDKNIIWQYIMEFHNVQQQEGLHLANKLRAAHIMYTKQKMKVRLATQVFTRSTSVADSFQLCKDETNTI